MSSKKLSGKTIYLIVWISLLAIILAAIFIVGLPSGEKAETIKEVMRDGVLHEDNKISLFGLLVNPALISAYIVSAALIIGAVIIRIFVIPHFKTVPGKFQLILEELVGFFSGMAKTNSPHKTPVVGSYIFGAGCYIFFSTIFELLGIQAVTTKGHSIALPAPIADINGAIAMGITSYAFILIAGAVCNGAKGVLGVLKDFSLPISMSFRLFGALLSGLLSRIGRFDAESYGACLLLCISQLRASCIRWRYVHIAARRNTDLCSYHTCLYILWRGC